MCCIWACAQKGEFVDYVFDWVRHHLVYGKRSLRRRPCQPRPVWTQNTASEAPEKNTSVSRKNIFKFHYGLNYIKRGKPMQALLIISVLYVPVYCLQDWESLFLYKFPMCHDCTCVCLWPHCSHQQHLRHHLQLKSLQLASAPARRTVPPLWILKPVLRCWLLWM